MADVANAYFRGLQAGEAAKEHKQALEDSKLRQEILKHSVQQLKLEDQLRARKLAQEHLDILESLPADQIPGDVHKNLPTTKSYAGAMTGLPGGAPQQMGDSGPGDLTNIVGQMVRAKQGGGQAPQDLNFSHVGQGQPQAEPEPAQPPLQSIAAPFAQENEPITTRTPHKVLIPGAGGVPDISVTPRSREQRLQEQIQAMIAAEMMKGFNLGPDQSRFVGGREVARGPKRTVQPTRASMELEAAGGDVATAAANMRQGSTSTDPDRALRLQHDSFVKDFNRRYPAASLTERENAAMRAKLTGKAPPGPPPAAPSFEKWREMTPQERQNVLQNPKDRIDDATMLERGRTRQTSTAAAAPARRPAAKPTEQTGEVPPDVVNMLQGVRPGHQVKIEHTDGSISVWEVLNDGSIRAVPQP